ncbi:MAG: crotonobetainyl-CoA--carnitine CoA-transferase [Chloroflexi bacterium]|nr:crotonobetainyl-CoA--carnitine CoA-transferase [Chloroflexota bacterium]|tara:strand:- start:12158 stop:12913 length:756 start_codon:yes stop_codon:yes gene_type:complete
MKKTGLHYASTKDEIKNREEFQKIFKTIPIPESEIFQNLGLFINRQSWSRILFLHELYKKIIPIPGNIFEFGTRFGQIMSFYTSLRGIYEPYNWSRKIIGFDTFEGFPKEPHKKDGGHSATSKGAYSTEKNYEEILEKILEYHESENPISHIKKFEIVKGDIEKTLDGYLNQNPHTLIALAYIDFNLYEPTKYVLEKIKPFLTKGSILAFDDMNHDTFPGETRAISEVLGLEKISLRRMPYQPWGAYTVIE